MSIRIVGAGAAGINVLDEWILLSDCPEGSLACDGEASSVEGSLASEKLLLAPDLVGGLGCFGSRDLAWRLVGRENQRLDNLLKDCTDLLIVTSLAGATGAAVAEALSLKAREREIPTTIFGLLPFPFEAEERQKAAQAAREGFSAEASVFVFSTARVFPQDSDWGVAFVRRGLRELQGAIAQWVDAWAAMANGIVLPAGGGGEAETSLFAGVGEIQNCHIFLGEVGSCLDASLSAFLETSEFRQVAEEADRCLGYVEASEEPSGWESELERRLQDQLPNGARISFFRRKRARSMRNRLMLLLGRAASALPKPAPPERVPEQRNQPRTDGLERSRITVAPERELAHSSAESTPFSKTAATLYKGENLDIPAFRRRSGSRLERK
ncbi:hypothetical protein [Verrucomicrobium sp. 3C]|uniref:hypothetical protein n=1 Tax=Verrucomicrobium sp. 3C TaxID=1134055 RepID=UPI00036C6D09|nr:hypothetical protein [Verrucomicrobium sp. 3C]